MIHHYQFHVSKKFKILSDDISFTLLISNFTKKSSIS